MHRAEAFDEPLHLAPVPLQVVRVLERQGDEPETTGSIPRVVPH